MRNVILLCLDTVRADYFSEYAPQLLDRADLRFKQCRAASSWSAPSHASMLTGTLPSEHGVHAYQRDFSVLDQSDTVIGDLNGHRTLGVSANVWASSSFGFDELFDEFSEVSPDRRFPKGIDVARFGQEHDQNGFKKQLAFIREALSHEHPIYSLANGALVQIDELFAQSPLPKPMDDGVSIISREALKQIEGTEPFFQFINIMDAHGPLRHVYGYDRSLHDAPNSWSSEQVDWGAVIEGNDQEPLNRYRGLYAAAIDYVDQQVTKLIDTIRERTSRETTIIITADHGDNFGSEADEGLWGHTDSSLSEGLIHVPLVVINPPNGCEGEFNEYVSHLSLPKLIRSFAQGDCADPTQTSIAAERVGHSGKVQNRDQHGAMSDRSVRCVYDGETKYEWDSLGNHRTLKLDHDELCFQAPADNQSDFNVEPLSTNFFSSNINEFRKEVVDSERASKSVDESTKSRLEELGYM